MTEPHVVGASKVKLKFWIVPGEKPGFVYSKCLILEMRDWTRHGDIFRLPVADEDILANIGPVTQVSQPLTQHQKLALVLPPIYLAYHCLTCRGQNDTGQPISGQSRPVPHPRPAPQKERKNFNLKVHNFKISQFHICRKNETSFLISPAGGCPSSPPEATWKKTFTNLAQKKETTWEKLKVKSCPKKERSHNLVPHFVVSLHKESFSILCHSSIPVQHPMLSCQYLYQYFFNPNA